MSNTNALATRQATGLLPDPQTWQTMMQMSEALFRSGLLPASIKTPQAAVAIVQKGSELGIPPMYALSNIVVIQGKPTANAELMLALIYRDHGDGAIVFTHSDNTSCQVSYKRRSWPKAQTYEFTMADAQTASLLGNQTWQKYPAAMLRARCISAVARMAFPDSIGGMYTAEELGASVDVVDGEVVIVDQHAETYPRPQAREAVAAVTAAADEPARSIVDVLSDELEDFEPDDDTDIEAFAFIAELQEVDDKRDLAPIKARITAAGLDKEVDVKNAYNAAYNRLHGVRDAAATEQEALPV